VLLPRVEVPERPPEEPLVVRLARGAGLEIVFRRAGAPEGAKPHAPPGNLDELVLLSAEDAKARGALRRDVRRERRVRVHAGRALLAGLPPGTYRFHGLPAGLHLSPAHLAIEGSAPRRVVVAWHEDEEPAAPAKAKEGGKAAKPPKERKGGR